MNACGRSISCSASRFRYAESMSGRASPHRVDEHDLVIEIRLSQPRHEQLQVLDPTVDQVDLEVVVHRSGPDAAIGSDVQAGALDQGGIPSSSERYRCSKKAAPNLLSVSSTQAGDSVSHRERNICW